MFETKAAVKSVGVIGPLVAVVVIALGMFGVDISGDVAGLPERIAAVVDSVVVIAGILAGIYGRVRATKEITGVFKPKSTGEIK